MEDLNRGFVYSTDYSRSSVAHYPEVEVMMRSSTGGKISTHLGNYNATGSNHSDSNQVLEPKNPLAKVNAKKTMAEISIPGMRAIFGHKAHIARRVTWVIILLICTTIAGVQVQDRAAFYLSTPVAVNVRVSRNDSLHFPVLTLCNKNLFNMTAMNILKQEKAAQLIRDNVPVTDRDISRWTVRDLVGVRGLDAQSLWDFLAHDWNRMMIECWFGRNVTCSQRGKWSKVYTYMGVCYSFLLNDPYVTTTGMFNNLYLKINESQAEMYQNDSGWKMLIHDEKDSPLIDIRTHGSTLYQGWAKDVRIYIRDFQTLNTRKRPCVVDEAYSFSQCVAKCFNDAAVKALKCRLPFMNDPTLKLCSTTESYNQSADTVEKLLFYGLWSISNCNCSRQCDQRIYVPYTETTQMEKVNEKIGKLRIYYQDLTFDDIQEEIAYGAIPLLCDVGGSLGLLLGASVLTFFEIIEAMSAALVTFTHKLINYSKSPRF